MYHSLLSDFRQVGIKFRLKVFPRELWKVVDRQHISKVTFCRFLSPLQRLCPQYPSVLICYQLSVGSPRYFVALGTHLKKHIKASHMNSHMILYWEFIWRNALWHLIFRQTLRTFIRSSVLLRKQCCIVDTDLKNRK